MSLRRPCLTLLLAAFAVPAAAGPGLCDQGGAPSPIDIRAPLKAALPGINLGYFANAVSMVNDGTTLRMDMGQGSTLIVGRDRYQLDHVTFQLPASHAIDGRRADMSAQLVHRGHDGRLAAVEVQFNKGRHNAALDAIWPHIPAPGERRSLIGVRVDLPALLPERRDYYHYTGSLTAAPCTEGVEWMVLKQAAELSHEQLAAFAAAYPGAAQALQPLNGRTVRE